MGYNNIVTHLQIASLLNTHKHMTHSTVGQRVGTLTELAELKKTYRVQDFKFTKDQRQRYDLLVELRRSHVNEYYEDGRVWIGPSMAGKKLDEGDSE